MEVGCTKIQGLFQDPSPLQKEGDNFASLHANALLFNTKHFMWIPLSKTLNLPARDISHQVPIHFVDVPVHTQLYFKVLQKS